MNGEVSVIVPVYNAELYIRRCLESIVTQSFKNFELIIVDDASTDGSKNIVKEFQNLDDRIKIYQQEHQGQAKARELGIEKSKTNYLVFIDADDYVNHTYLENLYYTIKTGNYDFVICDYIWNEIDKEKSRRCTQNLEKIRNRIRSISPTMHSRIWRREFILNNLKKTPKMYFEDVATIPFLVAKANSIGYTPDSLYYYCVNPNTTVRSIISLKDRGKSLRYLINLFLEEKIFEQNRNDLCEFVQNRCQVDLRVAYKQLYESMLENYLEIFDEHRSVMREFFHIELKNPYEKEIINPNHGGFRSIGEQRNKRSEGMYIYGVGDHIKDMLNWHPDLEKRIERIFDKDKNKIGKVAPGTGKVVESPEALRDLPAGTRIAIAAIRYFDEISRDLHKINPGLICVNIDQAYDEGDFSSLPSGGRLPAAVSATSRQSISVQGASSVFRHQLRGREARARWRQRFFMESRGCRHVWWGAHGVRAVFLRRQFASMMAQGDVFLDDDTSLRGQMLDGLPVCRTDALKDMTGKFRIVVLSESYAQIRDRLIGYGYVENVDFVEGRMLLGEDENGYVDELRFSAEDVTIPAASSVKPKPRQQGMIVYGDGAHLADMLVWHPEIARTIVRVIDKDPKKVGHPASGVNARIEPPFIAKELPPEMPGNGLGVFIEPLDALKDMSRGTEIVISAIRYFDEISRDIKNINPGLICKNIDAVWKNYVK